MVIRRAACAPRAGGTILTVGTAAETLAGFVAGLSYEDLPTSVVSAAKRHLTDAIGVALAAAASGDASPAADMVRSWAGARESTVIGYDFGAPAPGAALVNGTLAHALDFDDTHPSSMLHPSCVVMPAVLAVGEEVGASGTELIAAAAAGYEVGARIAAAAPGRFQARGFDTTGVVGPFAAAAVAARLWGLTQEETAHALGIAGGQAAGVLAHLADGADPRGMNAGWAAHAGIIAADLARRGATGAPTMFEGTHGFFDAFLGGEEPDADRLSRGLGADWETERIAIKPYPACHFLHAYMDAGARAGLKWADIEEIVCKVPPAIVGIVAEPRAPRLHPATTAAARYSLPFAVATAIVGGRDALELFGHEARSDRRVLTLAERVHHEPDASLPFPGVFAARMRIHTRSGRTHTTEEPVNRGHPDSPLSDTELAEKFMRNARARIDGRAAKRVLQMVQRLEESDAERLAALLRAP